jgi:hypothetical protein
VREREREREREKERVGTGRERQKELCKREELSNWFPGLQRLGQYLA